MSHLSTTIHVDASPEVVFDILSDPVRGTEWQTMLGELGDVSGRPGGIGSSFTGFYRVAGRRLESRFVVTAAERPTLFQLAGTTRGGWTRWTTLLEPMGRGCEVRVSLEYELPGEIVGGLFGILTGTRLQAELDRTYDNLRALAEAEAEVGSLAGGAVVDRGAAT
ncbi:MAG TPA: SRPBCC family protein [Candidatus Limnocylindrales bacterium]|nr:SRPBCC family protein [Candidatus Limnocylindrales bacterium]